MFTAALCHFWMLFQCCQVLSSQLEKRSSNIQLKHQCLPMDVWMTITLHVTSLQVPTCWDPSGLLTHLRLHLLPPPTHSHSKLSPASELCCFRCRFCFPWFFKASSSSFNSIQCHFFREVSPIILSKICLYPSPSIYFAVIFPDTTGFILFTILIMNSTYFIFWYPFIYLFICSFYFCSLSSIKSGISIIDNHFICNAKQELWHIIGPQ